MTIRAKVNHHSQLRRHSRSTSSARIDKLCRAAIHTRCKHPGIDLHSHGNEALAEAMSILMASLAGALLVPLTMRVICEEGILLVGE
jgi:hypothetical protein